MLGSVVVFPSPPEPQGEDWCHCQSSSVHLGHAGRKKGSHHPFQSHPPSTQLSSLEGIIREERRCKTQQVWQARVPGAGRELDWTQWAFPLLSSRSLGAAHGWHHHLKRCIWGEYTCSATRERAWQCPECSCSVTELAKQTQRHL